MDNPEGLDAFLESREKERAEARRTPFNGWSQFFVSNKGENNQGYFRKFSHNGVEERHQMVYLGKQGSFRILCLDSGKEEPEESDYYPIRFDTVVEAKEALERFTVEDFGGPEFDRIRHGVFLQLDNYVDTNHYLFDGERKFMRDKTIAYAAGYNADYGKLQQTERYNAVNLFISEADDILEGYR